MFQDEEFKTAFNELEQPNLQKYELFVTIEDIKIYRKYHESSCLYEYKVSGTLQCSADTCHQVYMDLEYRKQWDSYVKELYEKKIDDKTVIYWNVNFPFPLSNRDYTYIRESRNMSADDKQIWVILCQSQDIPSMPPKSGLVRVSDYKQFLVIKDCGCNTTNIFMHYFDNPGGVIPTWLINWGAKKGVPFFLDSMTRACNGYKEYLSMK